MNELLFYTEDRASAYLSTHYTQSSLWVHGDLLAMVTAVKEKIALTLVSMARKNLLKTIAIEEWE